LEDLLQELLVLMEALTCNMEDLLMEDLLFRISSDKLLRLEIS